MAALTQAGARIQGLAPVAGRRVRVLILGSMPSVASLEKQQYYGHPRNALWRALACAGVDAEASYRSRCAQLKRREIALWDVVRDCRREGSLDQAIRDARPNDLARFAQRHRELAWILFNGQTARRLFDRMLEPPAGVVLRTLPSTSPANTRADKLRAWRAALRAALGPPNA